MYELKRGKPFYFTFLFLLIGGLVPKNTKKSTLNFFFIQSCFYKVLFCFCNSAAPLLHVITHFRDIDEYDYQDEISGSIVGLSVFLVSVLFTVKWKQWLALLEDISKNTTFGRDPGFEPLAKRLNYASFFYTLYCYIAVTFYSSYSFLTSLNCKRSSSRNDLEITCNEYSPTWLIFEETSTTLAVTVFVFQTVIYVSMSSSSAITCFLIFETSEMIVSHISNLKRHFQSVFDVSSKEERKQRLGFCVAYHNYVLDLGYRLSSLCKSSTSIATVFCAISFGFQGSQIYSGNILGIVWYLLGYLIAIFCLCHAGQRIKDESYSIKDAVYASKWYYGDPGQMKDVMFIIARSQIPVYLETLPIGILDYPLYLLIVKTAYSYLTLLSQGQA